MKKLSFLLFIALACWAAWSYTEVPSEYVDQGMNAYTEGDYAKARQLFEKAENLIEKNGVDSTFDLGSFYLRFGVIEYSLENNDGAAQYMEKALQKVEKFSKEYELVLTFLGFYYGENSDNSNSHRILGLMDEHNQHELTKECNDPDCHLKRANYYAYVGEDAKAKEEYIAVFAFPLDEKTKSEAYSQYADFLYLTRDFSEAAKYLELALDIELNNEEVSENLVRKVQKAAVFYFLGAEYSKAIEKHHRVIEFADSISLPYDIKASSVKGIGNAYFAMNNYPAAVDQMKKYMTLLEENGIKSGPDYAKGLESLASYEKFNGDYELSIGHYEAAIDLYGELEMYDEQQNASDGLSMCYLYAGLPQPERKVNAAAVEQRKQKNLKILEESIADLESGGLYLGKMSYAMSLSNIAGSYAMLGEFNKAIDYYSQYIETVRDGLAESFLYKNPKERELAWHRELYNIKEIGNLLNNLSADSELYPDVANLMYESELLSKGILLSSNLEFEKVLNRYGTPQMKNDYEKIKDNLARIDEMKVQGKPVEDILDLTRETESMQRALAGKSRDYADFMNYLRITSRDIVNSLSDDSAAIEFSEIETGIDKIMVAVVISKENPRGISIPLKLGNTVDDSILKMNRYTQEVKRRYQENDSLLSEVNNISMDVTRDISSEEQADGEPRHYWSLRHIVEDVNKYHDEGYGRQIWEDILSVIPDKRKIYFAPVGLLNNIAIENLQFNGRPLSEQYELYRLSSTRELAREHQERPLKLAALFGDIDYIGDGEEASDKSQYSVSRASDGLEFGNLENTRREIEEINNIISGKIDKSFLYSGTKASRSEFISQQQIPVGLLHIATHGKYFDSDNEDSDAMRRSILAFAGANMFEGYEDNDGIVSAQDISEMSLHDCSLVVLSACESGLGKLGDDGVFGLQRGFKNAGVETLLVSLNEVADNVTADMMISFYTNLFNGGSFGAKQAAFRKAQADMRARYPEDDTWASFILIDAFK